MGALIPDGMTFDGVLPAEGRLPAIAFRYRPCLYLEMSEFYHPKANGTEQGKAALKLVKEHLVSWDVVDKGGQCIPLTEDTLNHLGSRMGALLNIIMTYAGEEQAASEKNSF